jgi:hypothetical protein
MRKPKIDTASVIDSRLTAKRRGQCWRSGPLDPTRRLLKVFGVKVTDYEERTDRIREEISRGPRTEELVQLAGEAVELTADLSRQLREMNDHILDAQSAVLAEVKTALERASAS